MNTYKILKIFLNIFYISIFTIAFIYFQFYFKEEKFINFSIYSPDFVENKLLHKSIYETITSLKKDLRFNEIVEMENGFLINLSLEDLNSNLQNLNEKVNEIYERNILSYHTSIYEYFDNTANKYNPEVDAQFIESLILRSNHHSIQINEVVKKHFYKQSDFIILYSMLFLFGLMIINHKILIDLLIYLKKYL